MLSVNATLKHHFVHHKASSNGTLFFIPLYPVIFYDVEAGILGPLFTQAYTFLPTS
jgi:hypothetical protein